MSGFININSNTQDPFYRYKMPKLQAKVEGKGNGIKTVIANMTDIGIYLYICVCVCMHIYLYVCMYVFVMDVFVRVSLSFIIDAYMLIIVSLMNIYVCIFVM